MQPEGAGKGVWFDLAVDGAPARSDDTDDEVDVDRLLAAFDDPADSGPTASVRTRTA